MFTAKTLKFLAATALVLFAASAAIGEHNDVLWVVDDIVFFGLILSLLALVVLTIGVLVRSRRSHVSISRSKTRSPRAS